MVLVIGIESTAHTFGVVVGIYGKIIAIQRDMYTTKTGGIIQMILYEHKKKIFFECAFFC